MKWYYLHDYVDCSDFYKGKREINIISKNYLAIKK